MFCRLGIYRRYAGTACHCSCVYELQLGRLEWLGLESSGSFLIYIYLLPRLALAQLELWTPTCNLSTVWWFHGKQTFFFFFFLIVLSLCHDTRELLLLWSKGSRERVVAVHGLSLIAMFRLSCPAAYVISVPRPRINLISPALEGEFLASGPLGKSWKTFNRVAQCSKNDMQSPWPLMNYPWNSNISSHLSYSIG